MSFIAGTEFVQSFLPGLHGRSLKSPCGSSTFGFIMDACWHPDEQTATAIYIFDGLSHVSIKIEKDSVGFR
jgi:hypothetical protein